MLEAIIARPRWLDHARSVLLNRMSALLDRQSWAMHFERGLRIASEFSEPRLNTVDSNYMLLLATACGMMQQTAKNYKQLQHTRTILQNIQKRSKHQTEQQRSRHKTELQETKTILQYQRTTKKKYKPTTATICACC